MDIGTTIRYINIILSMVAIPPAVNILSILLSERKIVNTKESRLNKLLTLLFGGIMVGALANAVLSLCVVTGNGHLASKFSIYRSVYTSGFFCIITWAIYLFQKSINGK